MTPCEDCSRLLGGDPIPPAHAFLATWENAPEGQEIFQCGKCGSLWRRSARFGWSRVAA